MPLLNPSLLALGLTLLTVLGWILLLPPPADGSAPGSAWPSGNGPGRSSPARAGAPWTTSRCATTRTSSSLPRTARGRRPQRPQRGLPGLPRPDRARPSAAGPCSTEFLDHVERNGWSVAVVGAGAEWLPSYEAVGLRPVYLGDEAVLDCTRFSLRART